MVQLIFSIGLIKRTRQLSLIQALSFIPYLAKLYPQNRVYKRIGVKQVSWL